MKDNFHKITDLYLEVTLVPAVLGQSVPQLLITPDRLQHVGRRLRFASRLAEGATKGRKYTKNEQQLKSETSSNLQTVMAGCAINLFVQRH